ncbi:tetratricopeptide repeat protein 33-like [Physella acuta]|uniref:tetratricopeptide repeat protein 33-like n=1 Tax=Physella acuta TaxID=109671 RepID=UPI0027DCDD68|nr:tetratricopeptide repeat protein 33-like [Physella acuta]XP_059151637.1 tetratricopeptide repeat protein 33-like [Physella acuta]XP_059151638.1 tetratricopeptide repeat protein 33-like [Physella acuta]
MMSFGWKRKIGSNVSKVKTATFSAETKDEESPDVDWLTSAPKRKFVSLEDASSKSQRLQAEGAVLAEAERYWEALKKWDEAAQLTPGNEKILEMKAQALMAVGEVFPALQMAEKTVDMAPLWWVGHQTLGRALANTGEVRLALKSFSRAVHLYPGDQELWEEDLLWTRSLLERRKLVCEAEPPTSSSVTITELSEHGTEVSPTERSVLPYSHTDQSQQQQHIQHLPRNYVQMRDPT